MTYGSHSLTLGELPVFSPTWIYKPFFFLRVLNAVIHFMGCVAANTSPFYILNNNNKEWNWRVGSKIREATGNTGLIHDHRMGLLWVAWEVMKSFLVTCWNWSHWLGKASCTHIFPTPMWLYVGSLRSPAMEMFTWGKSANATNEGVSFFPDKSNYLNFSPLWTEEWHGMN